LVGIVDDLEVQLRQLAMPHAAIMLPRSETMVMAGSAAGTSSNGQLRLGGVVGLTGGWGI